ncbi:putative phage protein gp47/JayE [Xenorhabdus cabanillasii]|uniref:Putative phage protein gp47/JayE n=1 Tax=Xenorhabdus cabanillasii TaxID=351673 RepID=A0A3D9UJL9_9GAMM|nr:baseplate J/gp47 family protein [Xenorhabdus cabanillasii]REF28613.1 putative phage protein gp47/JayE [Xenorhabdus cabanillasii]
MPFKRKTLTELRAQNRRYLQSELQQTGPLLRFSNMGVLADMDAGMAHLHYGYLDYIARQTTPFTATDEWLSGWAALKKIFRKPATGAHCTQYQFTGVAGAIIPAGTRLNRGDGYQYQTLTETHINTDGRGDARLTARLPEATEDDSGGGAAGNAPSGTVLTLDQSLAGVDVEGTAIAPITGGADIENEADFRSRMLLAYQGTPQGGASDDYKQWALSVPGITRVWVRPRAAGAGTVGVYIMCDNNAQDGFPVGADGVSSHEPYAVHAAGDQLRVANTLYTLQPVTALVWVLSPIKYRLDFTLHGLSHISTDVTARINEAIDNVLFENGNPDGSGRILISALQYTIADVPGTAGFVITSPTDNITLPVGHLPVRGEVKYT